MAGSFLDAPGFTVGAEISGIGSWFESAVRNENPLLLLLDNIQETLNDGYPEWAVPSRALQMAGDALVGFAEDVFAPPKARQNFGTEVAGALGQIVTYGTVAITSGGASFALMLGGGAKSAASRIKDAGAEGTLAGDAGIVAGGVITAALERVFKKLPDSVKMTILMKFREAVAAGGVEALEEGVDAFMQNLVAMGYDPNMSAGQLGDGVLASVPTSFTAGAIMNFVMSSVIPGKDRNNPKHSTAINHPLRLLFRHLKKIAAWKKLVLMFPRSLHCTRMTLLSYSTIWILTVATCRTQSIPAQNYMLRWKSSFQPLPKMMAALMQLRIISQRRLIL